MSSENERENEKEENKITLIGLLRVLSLIAFMAVLVFLSSCALVPKYDLRRQRYCEKDEIGYICPGSHERVRDPFERFRQPSAVINCVTSMEHVGSHMQTVEICE
jgi:hypothetical protein